MEGLSEVCGGEGIADEGGSDNQSREARLGCIQESQQGETGGTRATVGKGALLRDHSLEG